MLMHIKKTIKSILKTAIPTWVMPLKIKNDTVKIALIIIIFFFTSGIFLKKIKKILK